MKGQLLMEVYRYCSGCRTNKPESNFEKYKTCTDCRIRIAKKRAEADQKQESIARRNRRHKQAEREGREIIEPEDFLSKKFHESTSDKKPLYRRMTDEDWELLDSAHDAVVAIQEKRNARLQQAADFMETQTAERVPCGLCSVERPRKVMYEGLCVSCRRELTWQGPSFVDRFLDRELVNS
jgi:hypothetical protein